MRGPEGFSRTDHAGGKRLGIGPLSTTPFIPGIRRHRAGCLNAGKLTAAGVAVWLDRRWGVEARVPTQTRPHDDREVVIALDEFANSERATQEALMIIDSHVHLFFEGSDPDAFFIGAARAGIGFLNKKSGDLDADFSMIYETRLQPLSDTNGDKLVAKMNEAGVDKAIILPLDFWLGAPKSKGMSIEEKNILYGEATKRHKGRLLTHVGVDPRRRNALDILRKGVEEYGAIGLKLHPTAGFYPDDPVCAPLYEKALEYGIPVLIHSGNEPAPMRIKFSQPRYIDTVAAEYPDLKIIIAHAGHGWWQEAIDLASVKPNVYVDFAGWQMQYMNGADYFYHPLRFAIDTLGPWRVFFGTDGSMLDAILSPGDWVCAIKDNHSPSNIKFDSEEMDIVLGQAAARLYRIQ